MTTPKLPAVIDLSPFGPATLDADGVYRADMGGPSVTVTCGPGDFTVTGLGDAGPPRWDVGGGFTIVDEPPGPPWTPKGEGRRQRRKRERQARSKTTTRSLP